jgi:hypothetical protein
MPSLGANRFERKWRGRRRLRTGLVALNFQGLCDFPIHFCRNLIKPVRESGDSELQVFRQNLIKPVRQSGDFELQVFRPAVIRKRFIFFICSQILFVACNVMADCQD